MLGRVTRWRWRTRSTEVSAGAVLHALQDWVHFYCSHNNSKTLGLNFRLTESSPTSLDRVYTPYVLWNLSSLRTMFWYGKNRRLSTREVFFLSAGSTTTASCSCAILLPTHPMYKIHHITDFHHPTCYWDINICIGLLMTIFLKIESLCKLDMIDRLCSDQEDFIGVV